ncbi:hypothetical protein PF008_g16988 [Phytophthora fragariae]|uniref:Uncharacterized protein n=1 Tax=Phytophthora fragariae TaxID=53985 RepID=A0A6G0R9K2_9STRA|nr:hypothetical protein PF008_g16988 [Phytophthora fragariae]
MASTAGNATRKRKRVTFAVMPDSDVAREAELTAAAAVNDGVVTNVTRPGDGNEGESGTAAHGVGTAVDTMLGDDHEARPVTKANGVVAADGTVSDDHQRASGADGKTSRGTEVASRTTKTRRQTKARGSRGRQESVTRRQSHELRRRRRRRRRKRRL